MTNLVNLADVRKQRELDQRKNTSGDIALSAMNHLVEEFKARGFNVTDPVFIESIKSLSLLTKGMVDFNMQNDTNTSAYFRLAFDQAEDYHPNNWSK